MPRTILLLGVLALATASAARSQQTPKPPQVPAKEQADSALKLKGNGKGNTQPAAESLPPPPPAVAPAGNGEGQHQPDHPEENASEFWTVGGHRVKITDTLLVAFTFILAVATIYLWRATRDLVEGAEKTAERQLRAYMTVMGGKIFNEPRYGGRWLEWQPKITNVGQTPAYDVRVCAMADIRPVPLPDGADLMKELEPGEGSRSTVGPGEEIMSALFLSGPISDSDLEKLKARENKRPGEAFYVWGRVTYRDIFEKERRTDFCMLADWDNAGNPISKAAPQYNKAD